MIQYLTQVRHFMMMFRDKGRQGDHHRERGGQDQGLDGKEGPAIKLMGMEEHFGADVVLDKKGAYVFTVGTQLADGVKRQFVIKYKVK